MRREEALNILRGCIPSFNRKYRHWGKIADKEVDMSWMYLDEYFYKNNDYSNIYTLPEVVPYDFLVGTEGEFYGKKYFVVQNWNTDTRPQRHISLDITDFGLYGNTHKYGDLCISGLGWREEGKTKGIMSTTRDDIDPRIRGMWKMELRKILSPEDLGENADWEGFEAGEATQRFSNLNELLCTAAYVSLFRFQGPLSLNIGAFYIVPDEEEYLLQVDENDNVTFEPRLLSAVKKMQEED